MECSLVIKRLVEIGGLSACCKEEVGAAEAGVGEDACRGIRAAVENNRIRGVACVG